MTVFPVLRQKRALGNRGYQVDQALHDGINLTNAAFDIAVDRVYDVRGFAEISAVFRGGNNPSTFSILFSSKDFDNVNELVLADFEEVAEDVDKTNLTNIIVPSGGPAPKRLKNLVLTSDRKAVLVRMHHNGINTSIFGDITLTR